MIEEFVGPLAGWKNLKTDFGAIGNGVADDTTALQNAVTFITTSSNNKPVLFIPAGTYLITSTVTCAAALGISIIGADPTTTTLKWGGGSNGTLLHIDGVTLSAFKRLTFEGNSASGITLIDQSIVATGGFFDTGNEYVDNIFQNGTIGIQGGSTQGASESTVLRCKFYNMNVGVIIKNFNALDWWLWYCYFQNCIICVSNNPGAGNYHTYGCYFNTSTSVDLDLQNTGTFNFRDCYSLNSNEFLYEQFYYTNAAITRLQNTTVIVGPRLDGQPTFYGTVVDQGNEGPLLATDNIFVSPSNPYPGIYAIHIGGTDASDMVSIGNTYNTPNSISQYGAGSPRLLQLSDTTVVGTPTYGPPPPLPVAATNYGRTVFEVTAGASSATVQAAVNSAAAVGNKAVVHIQSGNYTFASTVTIPIGSNIQIIGDGPNTVIGVADPNIWTGWNNTGAGPVFYLPGPAKATLQDFIVNARTTVGIQVQTADQAGSRIFLRKSGASSATVSNVYIKLDNTKIEMHDIGISAAVAPAIGLRVLGAGHSASGQTLLLSGSGGNNNVSVKVSDGATAVVRDFWCEQNTGAFAQVLNSGNLTLEGSRASVNSGPAIQLMNMTGNAVIMSSSIDNGVAISGTTTGKSWVFGNSFESPTTPVPDVNITAFNLNRWNDHSYGSRPVTDVGTLSPTVQTQLLAASRATHPDPMADLPTGVTDVYINRVAVENGVVGFYLLGTS
jgi:hypothetical protein